MGDWLLFAEQEPWGEARADSRAAANTLFAMTSGSDRPNLFHPYFPDGEAMWEKHRELEAKQNSPEHQAKLKAARQKHIEEMKKRGQGSS